MHARHRPRHTRLALLLLVDAPAVIACLVWGLLGNNPYSTFVRFSDWRMQHPFTLLPSLLLVVWLVWRLRHRHSV